MGDLSAHFSRSEFRCRDDHGQPCLHCGGKAEVDPRLVALLEDIREFCRFPIQITSGCRCAKRNAEVGGKPESAHLTGEAADIFVSGNRDRHRLLNALCWLDVSRFGFAKNFAHIDVSLTLPQTVAWGYWT